MDTCSTQKPTAGHVARARDRTTTEQIVTFHYDHFEGRASLLHCFDHPPPAAAAGGGAGGSESRAGPVPPPPASLFRVFVTGVPVAPSAIIDLGSELEIRSVRLHYQYDIHLVTRAQDPARVLISYLLMRDPADDPCFVNLFRYTGPLPPDEPALGPARVPPATHARYIRIQALFQPCVPLHRNAPHFLPKWKLVEITAASLPS